MTNEIPDTSKGASSSSPIDKRETHGTFGSTTGYKAALCGEVDVTQKDLAEENLPGVAVAGPEIDSLESQCFAQEDGTRAPA